MHHFPLILSLLIILIPQQGMADWIALPPLQTNTSGVSIDAPVPGQIVQGSIVIHGNTEIDRFQSCEVDFSYENNPTNTWFLIHESIAPTQNGILATWDTTTITDGDYTLRLLVTLNDGTQIEELVNNLHVRNYSPIETDTPSPAPVNAMLETSITTATSTPSYASYQTPGPPTPTPLPTNPAVITSSQMALTLGTGGALSICVLTLIGIYLGLRKILSNHKQ